MKDLLYLALMVGGAIALIVQGDFGGAAIVLLILAMIIFVARAPFAGMPPAERRRARLVATALVLTGWVLAGILLWDWTGGSFAVAGVVAVVALGKALMLPDVEEDAATEDPSDGSPTAP